MLAYERKQQILELMRRDNRFFTVEELCETLFASGATIRRDLKELEESRLIRRARGGAILVEGGTSEDPLAFRETQNAAKKQIIADFAVKHIRDGMTLFLDSSSTVFTLARMLDRFRELKVITNGIKTALLLSDLGNVRLYCTGGSLRENSKSLVGDVACATAARFNADMVFMSCRGFSIEKGVSEASEEEYCVKRQFLRNSKRAILLCDTSKMDVDFLCRLAPLSDFYEVITERKDMNDLCNQHTQLSRTEK